MVHALEPDAQAGSLGTLTPEDLVENVDDAPSGPSPQVKQGMQQAGSKTGSKPRVR